ncbi:MAG TPA: MFS transporter [Ramlibacter sp.]
MEAVLQRPTTTPPRDAAWSAVGSMTLCVALLIATIASRFDRRHVLVALTACMGASLVLIALAPSFALLMVARALLGVTIGGFWSLSSATLMRLVPQDVLPKAIGVLYLGNAVATAFAAPIGSYLGGVIGWRGVFWALVPLTALSLAWQWVSLPAMPPKTIVPAGRVLALLGRPHVRAAMVAVMLTFGGAFATFTYLRPFLETTTHASLAQLSLLLLGLGAAGFVGTYAASALVGRHLQAMLRWLPLALGAVTLAMLAAGHLVWGVAAAMVAWGTLNSALPVAWFNWLTVGVKDEPEAAGGLMVAGIQLAIMGGATFGGLLLDHVSIAATFLGGAALLVLASLAAGRAPLRHLPT